MSADKSSPSDSSNQLKGPRPSNYADDLHGLSKIDRRIKRLKSHLSPSPYLLDLPSDRPYNVQPQQANDWRLTWRQNHPFDRKEKALQYMSFHHLEWEDSLLRPVGNWDDGKGRIMEEDPTKVEGVPSGPGTPLLAASTAKKKISMKDYMGKKSKQESSGTPSQQQPSHGEARSEEKVEEKLNGLPGMAKKRDGDPKEQAQNKGDERPVPPQTAGKKRPHENSDDSTHGHTSPKPDTHHPEKKARLESPIHEAPSKTLPRPRPTDLDLPRELSPSLPPNLDEIIPKQISPTLPAVLESELKHLPTIPNGGLGHRKSASVNSVLSEGKKSKSQALQENSLASPKPKSTAIQITNGTKDASKATPSPSFKATKTEKPGPGSGRGHKPSDSDVSQQSVLLNGLKPSSSQDLERSKEPKSEKKKVFIKLKYGRKNRIAVKRILGMKPHPKKVFEEVPPRKTKEEESRSQREKLPKAEESKTKSPLPRPEKRTRPADEDETAQQQQQQQKRPKLPSSLNLNDRPRTPVPPPFRSPAFSKSQFSTPKKDLKSVAMRRVDSGDGDARTPSGARSGTPTAPNSIERGTIAKSSPPNTSGSLDGRQEQKRQWRAEALKYEQLARSLKHEADKYLKAKEGPAVHVSEEDTKLGAVTAIETILCYMLSFFATDQAVQISTGKHATDANAWLTIMVYWYFVRDRVESFPDLRGLCLQIGALCRETICAIDMERLAQDPLPKNSGEGISPPSDAGNMTPNSAKADKYHREYVDFKARMVNNFQKARGLWVDGMRDLSVQKIKEEYPRTWAMQQSDATKRGKEKFVPMKYEGQFFLPLGATSSSIEAVRFGCALLGEWCKHEGIKWDSKIGL